jgi:MFS family permease
MRKSQDRAPGAAAAGAPPLPEVARLLWRRRTFRHVSLAAALHAFVGYGVGAFVPPFLARSHGLGHGEIGTWLGSIIGVFGAAGAFLGGALVDRLGVRDRRWNLWIPSLATVLGIPFLLFLMLWPEPRVGLLLAAPAVAAGAIWLGPVFSMTQTLVRLRMRAVASAILLFVINIIGLGLGPQTVGLLNDTVFAASGDEAVRWSLLCVLVVMNAWAAVHFLLAARTLREDLLAKDA